MFVYKLGKVGIILENSVSVTQRVPTLPCSTSSVSRPLHSSLKRLAPVRLPSPPITHRLVMPRCTRL